MSQQIAVIRATLKYLTQEELIRGMAPLISKRGLFIHTKTTRPVGSEVQFEFHLADNSRVYTGEGIVRKEIPFNGGTTQKSGMLVALRRVNRPFKEVVDAVLASSPSKPQHAAAADATKQSAETRTQPKQHIVEAHAGEGFDLFGDMDLDVGLDSLFSSIEKSPARSAQQPISDLYESTSRQDNEEDSEVFASKQDAFPQSVSSSDDHVQAEESVSAEAQAAENEGVYQDTPTPHPDVLVPPEEAYRPENEQLSEEVRNAQSQATTGEFEAIEYIAKAEREAYEHENALQASSHALSPEMQAGPDDATLELAPLSRVEDAVSEPQPNANEPDAAADTYTTQQQLALKDYDNHLYEDQDLHEVTADLVGQTAPDNEVSFVPETNPDANLPDAVKQPTNATLSGFLTAQAEETPSDLFAALHDDILGDQSTDTPTISDPTIQDAASEVQTSIESLHNGAAPASIRQSVAPVEARNQSVPAASGQAQDEPEPLFKLGPVSESAPTELPPSQVSKEPATLESLLKRADIRSKDVVMTGVDRQKAVAKKRTSKEPVPINIPVQQKTGLLSKLFNK